MSVNYYEPPVAQAAPNHENSSHSHQQNNQQNNQQHNQPPQSPPPRQTGGGYTPKPKASGRLRRIFGGMGAAVTTLRNTLANIIFIIILLLIIASFSGKASLPLPESFALRIAPTGILVDQRSYIDPASLLLSDENPQENETLVSDLVAAIHHAEKDTRVKLLVIEPGRMLAGGLSKLNEIGQALEQFKTSGKKVIAVSNYYSQDQYYLASFADEIYLHDMGVVEITGYGRYMNYYKSALDKLGVTIHAFRSGKYKDYLEPYLRDDMSAESREHNEQWINELWANYTGNIERLRRLPPGSINDYVNNLDVHMTLTSGDSAKLAVEKALVDKVGSRHELLSTLINAAGKSKEGDNYNGVDVNAYLADVNKKVHPDSNKVAVLVAAGAISDGRQPEGSVGSETMLELLRQVQDDNNIKALVIRIDSGGGSAFASEIIRSELVALREKNIPIYVSMGSVAASGGYWIATAADKIWAQPTTITGSIGVFGAFPTLEKSLEKIGVYTDGVGTTELAGSMRLDRPLSAKASKVVQQGVDNIYERFITLVADARKQDKEAIHNIAQGHVWTGNKAKEIGLVDELGTLNDAIKAIAEAADLSSYKVEFVQRPLSPKEEFLRSLTQSQAGALAPKSLLANWSSLGLLNDLGASVKPLLDLNAMNDPQGIYVKCLDCVAP
ncbi:signal peptide peptidase SppA [Cellvibrio fontiphilus]|uniref:Signal peptide peptidase SppA n=1 Tax=Cellvibrio fontiphilus TaxID=1815559 RepID=A0ABV7FG66_9GAMM